MSCFDKGFGDVHLFVNKENQTGLYKNQIGAIGAALAHFSTKNEPALITMPTGTGKTAVMIILSYVLKVKKVLVITPSQLVREQIVESFKNPEILIKKGIIQNKNLPKAYELMSTIKDKSEWEKILKQYDVFVGIPKTINKIIDQEAIIRKNDFDVIFIDEAHHSRAISWSNILSYFSPAKQVLLTATPFRRDNKSIKARLIYSYPLKQAFEDKLFSKINFIPVNTKLFTSPDDKNIAIAKRADEVYYSRANKCHRIIIRTDRKTDAERLLEIYEKHTNLKLALIHSNLGRSTIRARIKELKEDMIDGIICVDMMGEGYDFPALKIAAVHIPHKSLAITLQFVGRISRTNIADGEVATVIAGEQEFKIDTYQLYKEDSKDWSIVLPDLHGLKIQKTVDEQEFFDSFEDFTENQENLLLEDENLSIEDDDLNPFFHAKIYKIKTTFHQTDDNLLIDIHKSIDFAGTDYLKNPIIRHHHISSQYEVAVYLVSELRKPEWFLSDKRLRDVKNELFIIYFDRNTSMLFIGSTIKENELYEHIASQYLVSGAINDMIPMPYLKRAMAGWIEPKMYNVGLKSRKIRGNGESYKQIMGSLAQMSVLPSDRFGYTRGHSFGGGFDPILNKEVLLGISTSSKIWSLEDNKIKYFVEWCHNIAQKVSDPEMDKQISPLAELDCGKVVESFPTGKIFFADWDSKHYYHFTTVTFIDNDGVIGKSALLCSCKVVVVNQSESLVSLLISKGNFDCKIQFILAPKVNFEYAPDTNYRLAITRSQSFSDFSSILHLLNESPINLFFEDLAKLVGCILYEFNPDKIKTLESEQFISPSWGTINVFKEFYSPEEIGKGLNKSPSIHEYIIEEAKKEYDVVFYDHASLEIADVIGLKKGKLQFWHCKKQNNPEPNCSITDIYEVCGQAVKSITWSNKRLLIKQIYDRAEQNDSSSKFKKGDLKQIKDILDSFDNPNLPVIITIVHPGLKTKNLDNNQKQALERIKVLLSGANTYLTDLSSCKLLIMCS
jgi:superfamily II DNA or RNA helicase